MAGLGSLRQRIVKLKIQVININLSSERPRAIAVNRWHYIPTNEEILTYSINTLQYMLTFGQNSMGLKE